MKKLSKKARIILISVLSAVLVVGIVGLSIGLSTGKKKTKNTDTSIVSEISNEEKSKDSDTTPESASDTSDSSSEEEEVSTRELQEICSAIVDTYANKYADILTMITAVDKDAVVEQVKAKAETEEGKAAIEYFVDEILPANCDEVYVGALLDSIKEFVEADKNAISAIEALYANNEKLEDDLIAKIQEVKSTLDGIIEAVKSLMSLDMGDTELDPRVLWAFAKSAYEGLYSYALGVGEEIVGVYNEDVSDEDKALIISTAKDLFGAYSAVINAFDGKIFADIFVNLALADKNEIVAKLMPLFGGAEEATEATEEIGGEGLEDEFEVGGEFEGEEGDGEEDEEFGFDWNWFFDYSDEIAMLGLNQKEVRQAYAFILEVQLDQLFRIFSFEKIDVETFISFYGLYQAQKAGYTVDEEEWYGLASEVLYQIGDQISYCALTDDEMDVINAYHTINEEGLEILAVKVLPTETLLLRYIGYALMNANAEEFMSAIDSLDKAGCVAIVNLVKDAFGAVMSGEFEVDNFVGSLTTEFLSIGFNEPEFLAYGLVGLCDIIEDAQDFELIKIMAYYIDYTFGTVEGDSVFDAYMFYISDIAEYAGQELDSDDCADILLKAMNLYNAIVTGEYVQFEGYGEAAAAVKDYFMAPVYGIAFRIFALEMMFFM